jgi:hypothetical protein
VPWHNADVLIVDATTADAAPIFLQYGAIGAIALLALIAVKVMFDRLNEEAAYHKQRADRYEIELRQLNETVRTEYLGTLAKATEAISDALAAVRRS